jgi:hypothetical protein
MSGFSQSHIISYGIVHVLWITLHTACIVHAYLVRIPLFLRVLPWNKLARKWKINYLGGAPLPPASKHTARVSEPARTPLPPLVSQLPAVPPIQFTARQDAAHTCRRLALAISRSLALLRPDRVQVLGRGRGGRGGLGRNRGRP